MSGRESFAVILILVGVLMLARNFGLVTWGVWDAVSVLWPVVLVAFGISLALRGCGVTARARRWLVVCILVIAGVGLALWVGRTPGAEPWSPRPTRTRSFEVPPGAYAPEAVSVRVSAGSSRLTIGETERPGFFFSTGTYYRPSDEPQLSERMAGTTLVLEYKKRGGVSGLRFLEPRDTHQIELGAYDLPTEVGVDVGSGDATLTLGRTRIRSVDLDVGSGRAEYDAGATAVEPCEVFNFDVGSGRVDLAQLGNLRPREVSGEVGSGSASVDLRGEWGTGEATVSLRVGSGHVALILPEGGAVALTGRVGSGTVSFNGQRFSRRRFSQSEKFETAAIRLRINVDVSSGEVAIRTTPGNGTGAWQDAPPAEGRGAARNGLRLDRALVLVDYPGDIGDPGEALVDVWHVAG